MEYFFVFAFHVVLLFGFVSMETLEMVHLVYRHGARSPTSFYPTNPYKNHWKDGLGMLTQEGMRMEYTLGKFLKKRYMEDSAFLNTSYLHKEVYIRSSDSPRCLQSALSQLAGLYPPKGRQIWNKAIPNWQPIPVHTVPGDQDPVLRPDDDHCPRRSQIVDLKYNSVEAKVKATQHQNLLKFLSNYSGWHSDNFPVQLSHASTIDGCLECEAAENLPPPSWLHKGKVEELKKLSDWYFWLPWIGDDELGRLTGGTLLNKIVNNMKALIKSGNDDDKEDLFKMNIFSGHDTSVSALFTALNITDVYESPYFTACIMVELHKDKKDYFVKVYYRNDTKNDSKVYPIKLKSCDKKCRFDNFVGIVKDRLANESDRKNLCARTEPTKKPRTEHSHAWKVASLICIAIIIVLLLLLVLSMVRNKRRNLHVLLRDEEGDAENLLS